MKPYFKGIYFKMPFKIKLESEEVGEWGNMSVLSVVMSMTRLRGFPKQELPQVQHGNNFRRIGFVLFVGQPRESLKNKEISESVEKKPIVTFELPEDMRELSSIEMAALCTNWPGL